VFFFSSRRRHTRFSRDWSSDVCSSDLGEIRIELFEQEAPVTVANFLQYVDDGFYDGTIFHRVIPGFMIQGGGFTPEMEQKQTRRSEERRVGKEGRCRGARGRTQKGR